MQEQQLTECDKEPIHLLSAINSSKYLLTVADSSYQILAWWQKRKSALSQSPLTVTMTLKPLPIFWGKSFTPMLPIKPM